MKQILASILFSLSIAVAAPPITYGENIRSQPMTPDEAAASSAALFQRAEAMEKQGDMKQAMHLYRLAAHKGSGPAAKRLGDIYGAGISGVNKDYNESLMWYEKARQLGEVVELPPGKR